MRRTLMPFQGLRITLLKVMILLAFLGLIARMYYFQIEQHDYFNSLAQGNAQQSVPLPAPRGVIYDRYGVDLARNDASFNVGIIPAALPDSPTDTVTVYNRLSALLAIGNINVPSTRAVAAASGLPNVRSIEDIVAEGNGIAPYRSVIIATDVDRQIAQMILEDIQSLPGVVVDKGPVREYPTKAFTSQIIGYLGPISAAEAEKLRETGYNPAYERVGYAGIEAFLDDQLSGQRGLETRVVDVAGQPIRVVKRDEPIPGQNVKLTLDLDLQKAAQGALESEINFLNATCREDPEHHTNCDITQSGVVIALDPQTGEVLAMVSLPTYDNSRFARGIDANYYFSIKDLPQNPFINHAVSSLYPPGSTWKVVTGSAVVQDDVIAPTTFLNDPGSLDVVNSLGPLANKTKQRFVCWLRSGHGQVDLFHGIAWSCDVYFYQIGGGNPAVSPTSLRDGGLGIQDLDRYATMFGIGTREGIELPAEEAGRLPDPTWKRRVYSESWGTGDTYNASFGQGYITVTPLQLANAVASIANGGTLYQPTLIEGFTDTAGNLLQPFQPQVERTIAYPQPGQPIVLNMREDMYLQGNNSLTCVCEQHSDQCTPDFIKNYKAQFTLIAVRHKISVDYHANQGDLTIDYTVHVPLNYLFTGRNKMCDPLQFGKGSEHEDYQPAFVDPQNLALVRAGMRGAVMESGGTVNLVTKGNERKRVETMGLAGKTGTAEYCDNIAFGKNLCIPGSWPQHAWFAGFAPYNSPTDKPEIVVIAMVYNGGEGSYYAYPVVQYTIDCYFYLKLQREHGDRVPSCSKLPFNPPTHTPGG
ncbi:MAG TPA: penicillin-binding transpeptidase domain-containing protein [Aggregatilineales bacterium]|nr:penicillin-binding transpeptidase domain-containing protein [Aggregatilineales bacterium]